MGIPKSDSAAKKFGSPENPVARRISVSDDRTERTNKKPINESIELNEMDAVISAGRVL